MLEMKPFDELWRAFAVRGTSSRRARKQKDRFPAAVRMQSHSFQFCRIIVFPK